MTQNDTKSNPVMYNEKPFISPRALHSAWQGVVGLEAIYERLRSGDIRNLRVGTKYLIPRAEIEGFPKRVAGEG